MPHPLLGSVYLKLGRAALHLNVLQATMDGWTKKQLTPPITFTTNVEGRGKNQRRVTRFKTVKPPPDDWGLIAGDAAHNMRCVLDHLVCALARLNGATSITTNSFPLYPRKPDQDRFEETIQQLLANLRDEHRDLILNMQPYLRKNPIRDRRLVALGLLDNMDKHQVVTTARVRLKNRIGEELPDGARYVIKLDDISRDPVLRFPKDPVVEPGRKAWWTDMNSHVIGMPVVFDFAFGEPRISRGELLEIHGEVARIVEDVVTDFERIAPTSP